MHLMGCNFGGLFCSFFGRVCFPVNWAKWFLPTLSIQLQCFEVLIHSTTYLDILGRPNYILFMFASIESFLLPFFIQSILQSFLTPFLPLQEARKQENHANKQGLKKKKTFIEAMNVCVCVRVSTCERDVVHGAQGQSCPL